MLYLHVTGEKTEIPWVWLSCLLSCSPSVAELTFETEFWWAQKLVLNPALCRTWEDVLKVMSSWIIKKIDPDIVSITMMYVHYSSKRNLSIQGIQSLDSISNTHAFQISWSGYMSNLNDWRECLLRALCSHWPGILWQRSFLPCCILWTDVQPFFVDLEGWAVVEGVLLAPSLSLILCCSILNWMRS